MEKAIKLAAAAAVKRSNVTRTDNVHFLSLVTKTINGKIAIIIKKTVIISDAIGKKILKMAKQQELMPTMMTRRMLAKRQKRQRMKRSNEPSPCPN